MRITRLLLPLILLFTVNAFSQTEFQFGLNANPMLTWMKAENSKVNSGKVRMGLEYGLMMDINFSPNYILATGITATLNGGNLIYTDSSLMRSATDTLLLGDVNAKFKLQYINLPVVFKMRTNDIGNFRYYGGIGLVPGFRFKARVDAESRGNPIFENANIVKRKDQTDNAFRSTFFDLSLHVEGGIEFPLNGKTSLIAGIFYRNGFVNVTKDRDDDRISLNNAGMRIGILF